MQEVHRYVQAEPQQDKVLLTRDRTPEARNLRKAWIPHPEQSNDKIPTSSSWLDHKRANRSPTSSSGGRILPSTLPTNQGGQRGSGAPMAYIEAGRRDSVGWWHHRLPQGLCLGRNRFYDPSQGKLMEVLKPLLEPKNAGLC